MPETSGVFVTLDRQQHGGTTDCPACLGNARVYDTEFRARFERCRRRKSLLPCKPNEPVGGEAQATSSCSPPAGMQQARSWSSSPAGVRDACNTAPDVPMDAGCTAPLVRQDETMEETSCISIVTEPIQGVVTEHENKRQRITSRLLTVHEPEHIAAPYGPSLGCLCGTTIESSELQQVFVTVENQKRIFELRPESSSTQPHKTRVETRPSQSATSSAARIAQRRAVWGPF